MLRNLLINVPVMCVVAVTAIALVSEPAAAAPTDIGFSMWGQNPGGPQMGLISDVHPFNTQGQIIGSQAPPAHFVTVSSSPSQRQGWQYELTMSWFGFNQAFYPTAPGGSLSFELDIKEPGSSDPIIDVLLKGPAPGQVPFPGAAATIINGGGTIHVDIFQFISQFPGPITVQWNQAPAPGALALLGLAGVVGGTRRRRSS